MGTPLLLCEKSAKLENDISPISVDGDDNSFDIKRDVQLALEEQDKLASEWLWTMSDGPMCWMAKVSAFLLVVYRLSRR